MNKFIKVLTATCLAMGTFACSFVEASNLDTYRNLLINKKYTIKYVNITPEERVTNRDKVTLVGNNTMKSGQVSKLLYKPLECVVVADGANRYEEIGVNNLKTCRLQNNNGTYFYTKYDDAGKTSFWGTKKNTVTALPTNTIAYAMQGDALGSGDMTRLLNAILPDYMKSSDMPSYRYVNSGWLSNGLNYVDYKSDGRNMEAIRYYFNGYTLVKIASAQFVYDDKGQLQARRCIIKINEFSPTPAKKYLVLPNGIKEVTKKAKKTEDEE